MKLLNNIIILSFIFFTLPLSATQVCKEGNSQPNARFVIFDDAGLVRDRVTGLLWQRCSVGQIWNGRTCEESSKRMIKSWFSWQELDSAIARTEKLSNQNGWRVPSIDELLTITNFNCKEPAINESIFPNTANWRYWSSTPFIDNDKYVWSIDFSTGVASTVLKSTASYHVRLVKGKIPRLTTPQVKTDPMPLTAWNDGIHNLSNPDIATLQPKSAVYVDWHLNDYGEPDWAALLRDQNIQPRVNKDGTNEDMIIWEHDIVFRDTNSMPWVKFPHKTHTQWLACTNCHDEIFAQKTGTANISMGSIYSGQHCGKCHGTVAFTLNDCARCHSQLHKDVSPEWEKFYSNK